MQKIKKFFKLFYIMSSESEYLVDLIFKKLKNYKSREIPLEKESLKRFIYSLLKQN